MSPIELPKDNKKTPTAPSDKSGQIEWLKYVVNGILLILSLSFITLLFNYYQQSAISFEGLKDEITTQNSRIDFLTTQLEIYSNRKIK